MKNAMFRGKRAVIATAATVVALGAGGAVWTSAAQADGTVDGSERDRVGAAAVQAVGGGTVIDVETSDDTGEAYEAEVRKDDGTEVDVALDKDLKVLAQESEGAEGDTAERQLTPAERRSAEAAARTAVPGGTITDVEAGDDGGAAWEVEVRATDNTEWDVELDAAFKVLTKTQDK
ncbi:PepSY domain-containing protein [Actinoplanes sp. NPDC049316]|uniref:PepSY domain-containing protein n=1 Tax=Actinoplanes sp. NPDC049316 TaxID=3154727 RepID=UPI003440FC3A